MLKKLEKNLLKKFLTNRRQHVKIAKLSQDRQQKRNKKVVDKQKQLWQDIKVAAENKRQRSTTKNLEN